MPTQSDWIEEVLSESHCAQCLSDVEPWALHCHSCGLQLTRAGRIDGSPAPDAWAVPQYLFHPIARALDAN